MQFALKSGEPRCDESQRAKSLGPEVSEPWWQYIDGLEVGVKGMDQDEDEDERK